MVESEIEARIRRLEDIDAIKTLRAKFCYAMDTVNWEEVASMFTEDAVAEMGTYGRCEGRDEIAKFARETLPASLSFVLHMLHNPVIEVDGDKATGEWYFEAPLTYSPPIDTLNTIGPLTHRAMWAAGKFEDEYIKIGGEWKFKKFASKMYYETPYDEGWVKTRIYR